MAGVRPPGPKPSLVESIIASEAIQRAMRGQQRPSPFARDVTGIPRAPLAVPVPEAPVLRPESDPLYWQKQAAADAAAEAKRQFDQSGPGMIAKVLSGYGEPLEYTPTPFGAAAFLGHQAANITAHLAHGQTGPAAIEAAMVAPMLIPGGRGLSKTATESIVKEIPTIAERGGATFTQAGEHFAGDEGYAVGKRLLVKPQERLTPSVVRQAAKNVRPDEHMGFWFNPNTGRWEIDATDIASTADAAMQSAAQAGQAAIYDFKGKADIPLPQGPGVPFAANLVREYRAANGLPLSAGERVTSIDKERAGRIAQWYEQAKSTPNDPMVQRAYKAFADEVEQQYQHLIDSGLKIEFVKDNPYKNSAEMMKDVAENLRLKVYETNDNPHPLLTKEQNDHFRAVHEIYGHAASGYQFGPIGETGAFQEHFPTFSPLAQRAMATETMGQNSWFNFGPHSSLPVPERPFAEQKAALMPPGLLDAQAPQAPNLQPLNLSKQASQVAEMFTPEEQALLSSRTADTFNDAVKATPEASVLAEGTVAGSEGRNFYKDAQGALHATQLDEAGKAADVISALSPHTFLEKNWRTAKAALQAWRDAGRPGSDVVIRSLGLPDGAMEGHFNNLVRALANQSREWAQLSGPKVRAFAKNLRGLFEDVTLDTWMAKLAGWNPKRLAGSLTRNELEVSSPGYLAYTGRVRQVARTLGLNPAEVQASLWKYAKDAEVQIGARPEQLRNIGTQSLAELIGGPTEAVQALGEADPAALARLERNMRRSVSGKYLFSSVGLRPGGGAAQLLSGLAGAGTGAALGAKADNEDRLRGAAVGGLFGAALGSGVGSLAERFGARFLPEEAAIERRAFPREEIPPQPEPRLGLTPQRERELPYGVAAGLDAFKRRMMGIGLDGQPLLSSADRELLGATEPSVAPVKRGLGEAGSLGFSFERMKAGGKMPGFPPATIPPYMDPDPERRFSALDRFVAEGEFGRSNPKTLQQWIGWLEKNVGVGKGGYSREELEANLLPQLRRQMEIRATERGVNLPPGAYTARELAARFDTGKLAIQERIHGNVSTPRPGVREPEVRLTIHGPQSVRSGLSSVHGYHAENAKPGEVLSLKIAPGKVIKNIPAALHPSVRAIAEVLRNDGWAQAQQKAESWNRHLRDMPDQRMKEIFSSIGHPDADVSVARAKIHEVVDAIRNYEPPPPAPLVESTPLSGRTKWEQYHRGPFKGTNYREHVINMPNLPPRASATPGPSEPQFMHSLHWPGVDNPLAHIFTEDMSVGGKKALHPMELQSDWVQTVRKEGVGDSAEIARLEKELEAKRGAEEALRDRYQNFFSKAEGLGIVRRTRAQGTAAYFSAGQMRPRERDAMGALEERIREASHARMAAREALEDAQKKPLRPPIGTKTETVTRMMLKSLLERAAREDYHYLVMPKWSQVADRYNLRQVAKRIEYVREGDPINHRGVRVPNKSSPGYFGESGEDRLTIYTPNGGLRFEPLGEHPLEAYVGNEVAKTLREKGYAEGGDFYPSGRGGGATFYEEIAPRELRNYVKELTGKPATEVKRKSAAMTLKITPELRAALLKGQALPALGAIGLGAAALSAHDKELLGIQQ